MKENRFLDGLLTGLGLAFSIAAILMSLCGCVSTPSEFLVTRFPDANVNRNLEGIDLRYNIDEKTAAFLADTNVIDPEPIPHFPFSKEYYRAQ